MPPIPTSEPTQQSQAPTVPTPPPTTTTRRSGMMFCVVGDGLASTELFKNNLCDYIVYPDLVAESGQFTPLLGRASWSIFQEVLASAVSLHAGKKAMVFLGVWLPKDDVAQRFAAEVSTIAHVNTIIIQTHISLPFVLGHTLCISRPVSVVAANDITPSFEVAQRAEALLRSRGDKFRIMFSSTLGVMVYVGTSVRNEPSGPNQGCDQSYMADWDFLCSGGAPLGPEVLDRAEMYAYIVYKDGVKQHFVTYENSHSLLDKMDLYVEKASDGWAMFEAHRDSAKDCAIQERFQRLKKVQMAARNRIRRGGS
ncbi:uncharacterized protein LOC119171395 isoform X2 [Rhipicephalus microplus]